jgi:hypothetical protein
MRILFLATVVARVLMERDLEQLMRGLRKRARDGMGEANDNLKACQSLRDLEVHCLTTSNATW